MYFTNEYDAAKHHRFLNIFKWKFFYKNPQKLEQKQDSFMPRVIHKNVPSKEQNKLVWLGHAAFMLDLAGVRILLDPCLTNPPTVKRKTKLPFLVNDIYPDVILISHGHYDHFDVKTLKYFNNTKTLMPLGLSRYAKKLKLDILELDWHKSFSINDIEITFLPSYHWHSRYGFDKNQALWGSFLIRHNGLQIYFCGDSGYNTHFELIRKRYGSSDICIMPLGAYKPDFIMKHSHMNPHESIQAFKDLGGKIFIPMHYGTFELSDEPPSEGIKIAKSVLGNNIKELDIGESYLI